MSVTTRTMYVQRNCVFVQPFLQRKSNMYYTFWVCICSLR